MMLFVALCSDLVSWCGDMKNLVSSDELAKDVPGAEALLERHQERKVSHLSSNFPGFEYKLLKLEELSLNRTLLMKSLMGVFFLTTPE